MKNITKSIKPRFCENLRKYFKEYCDSSTIHGFRYFGEQRTYLERYQQMIYYTELCGDLSRAETLEDDFRWKNLSYLKIRYLDEDFYEFLTNKIFTSISRQRLKTNTSKVRGWSLETGYLENDLQLFVYPFRAIMSGSKKGLTLELESELRYERAICYGELKGFTVTLHHPMELPRPAEQNILVPLDHVVFAKVHPEMITTSNTLKMYKPIQRNCYFQNERPLRYFKVYSQQNCLLECVTNITIKECGCARFFMPRSNDTKICGPERLSCAAYAAEYKAEMNYLFEKDPPWLKQTNEKSCKCLPSCTELRYDVTSSSTVYQWDAFKSMYIAEGSYNLAKSRVQIYFNSRQFLSFIRHELYGPTDFVSNFGGLLGLFTGFSMLSLMELLYFLTIRIICNIWLFKRWSGAKVNPI